MNRWIIKVLAACALVTLAACSGLEDLGDERAYQPIPAGLLSQMSARRMSAGDPIFVRIYKKESELELWKRDGTGRFALLKTYPMCRWSGQLGPKKTEGDRQAPEGIYEVDASQLNPKSKFHLSFNLGYPNAYDQIFGRTGTALMVHGACTSSGCYAITNEGIAELYAVAREALAAGQPSFQVQALPFRMTAENLAKHRANPNIAFWKNLEEGVDHFDVTKQPPQVAVCGKRYVFNANFAGGSSGTPAQPCPAFTVDPALTAAIAEKHRDDEARIAALIGAGAPAVLLSYTDGAMHPVFQQQLKELGPDGLKRRTSNRNVPISRPDAALVDPEILSIDATGGVVAPVDAPAEPQ